MRYTHQSGGSIQSISPTLSHASVHIPPYLDPGSGHPVVVVVAGQAVVHDLLEDGDERRHQVAVRLGVLPARGVV